MERTMNLSTTGSAVAKRKTDQPAPLSLRADPSLLATIEKLARRFDMPKHAVSLAALRLGLQAIDADPSQMLEAQKLAHQAELDELAKKLL
jgi:hypothetical protein